MKSSSLKSKILQAIKRHGGWGLFELSQHFGIDMKLACKLTDELLAEGRIKHQRCQEDR